MEGERKKGECTPMAVEPSFMASREYSTWKRRPSGENVLVRVNLWGLEAWNFFFRRT